MSIEAFSWALNVPIGGNAKIVLLGLANHAHADGTEAYPALDTLAGYAHCDRSTARRNVRKLLDLGWIREDGLGPKGQNKYALAMSDTPFPTGGGETPPVANEGEGGGKSGAEGVAPDATRTVHEPSTETGARASAKDKLPDSFPEELRPHAVIVFKVLRAVAQQHNAREVTPLALGNAMMARRRKPFVKAAYDFASWAANPPRPIRDVVGSYRTWLDRESDLAGTERLPNTAGPALPQGPPADPRRESNEDFQARLRRRFGVDNDSGEVVDGEVVDDD